MKSLAPDSIDRLCQDLEADGCTPEVVERLLDNRRVQELRQSNKQEILASLSSLSGPNVLESLLLYTQVIINFRPEDQSKYLQVIGSKLQYELSQYQKDRYKDNSIIRNLFNYRSLLLQVMDISLLRNTFIDLCKVLVAHRNIEHWKSLSMYFAMYFSDLQKMFPDDPELLEAVQVLVRTDHWSVPLFAFASPTSVYQDDTLPSFLKDDSIALPDIVSSRRADRCYRSCPQAENNHLLCSSDLYRRNTFVFSNGVLLGSLKHGHDSMSREKTFLSMRTVATNPDDLSASKFPLIFGGLYLISDGTQLSTIMSSGRFCDLPGKIAFMPLRATNGTGYLSVSAYHAEILQARESAEAEYRTEQSIRPVDSTHAHR